MDTFYLLLIPVLVVMLACLYFGIRRIGAEAEVLGQELVESAGRSRAEMEELRSGGWLRLGTGEVPTAFAREDVFSTYGGRKAVLVASDGLYIVLVARAEDGLIYKVLDCVDVSATEILDEDGAVVSTLGTAEEDFEAEGATAGGLPAGRRGRVFGRLGYGFSKFEGVGTESTTREPATRVKILTTDPGTPDFLIDLGSSSKAQRLHEKLAVVIKRGEQYEREGGGAVQGIYVKPDAQPSRTTAWLSVPDLSASGTSSNED